MTIRPASDVRTTLIAGVTSPVAAVSGNTFAIAEHPGDGTRVPVEAFFCSSRVGGRQVPYMGTVNQNINEVAVQVVARGRAGDPQRSMEMAIAGMEALHRADLSGIDAGYMSCLVREADPIDLGPNDQEQWRHAFNVVLMFTKTIS